MKRLLETRYAGLSLKNPLIVGSSGLTSSVEKIKELEKAGAAAVVLQSLFEEQISMQSDWLLENGDYPEANNYISQYVKSHEIVNYLELIQQAKSNCRIPVIASINCYKSDSWTAFVRQIEMAGADAIELNIFVLNTEINVSPEALENKYIKILNKVKDTVNIPVTIKIGKQFNNITNLVHNLYSNGASGVVLFNRFYQPDIDINKLQFVSGQVFSSHYDIADTLRWTSIVAGRVPQISLAASTGIHEWEDVVKCILAGASAVELCSAIYLHGNEMISQICRSLEEWMVSMNFKSIESFAGKLSSKNIADPSLYERVQFMKYFSNRD
ncbi:MAG: dihydroorotate dehydrogenase-like protein [Candidatus Azobacteroides sp.]|nr:dihydroorotate dehydrogenase-like protein [Candidatus Azobacteroides sp.]